MEQIVIDMAAGLLIEEVEFVQPQLNSMFNGIVLYCIAFVARTEPWELWRGPAIQGTERVQRKKGGIGIWERLITRNKIAKSWSNKLHEYDLSRFILSCPIIMRIDMFWFLFPFIG